MNEFKKARAVWGKNLKSEWNQILGFFSELTLEKEQEIIIAVAARSYYRLYINGKMLGNGPAHTAHGYCRIDEIPAKVSGCVQIGVEVIALDKANKYSNDCTLEPGLFACEIIDGKGRVLSATGDASWKYRELIYRRPLVETMSHSRGILEWCDLNESSFNWRMGDGGFESPVLVGEKPKFLPRRAPYASYRSIPMETVESISDICPGNGSMDFTVFLSKYINGSYYELIPEENIFLEALCKEQEAAFSGKFKLAHGSGGKEITLLPGERPCAVTFGRDKTELGFIDFHISVSNDCCVDVINSDHLEITGEFKNNTYVTRYCLKPGSYHLTTHDPKLTRYIKVIARGGAKVKMSYPVLLDYSYDDKGDCFFSCNDGELNAIYAASKRTLRLNTLDIFMDCPERERGGWLCDSYFSAMSAWQMFGDLRIEKDFIENFMLTDGAVKWKGFFPEVYPGNKAEAESVGITTWSFWLAIELHDYYLRSGDRAFIDKCRERICCFIEGLLSLRGESGLLEGLGTQFVDWSLSNKTFCLSPINIPNNCLAVCVLEKMAELYEMPEWQKNADEMRHIIEALDGSEYHSLRQKGDSAIFENGQLRRSDCLTEAGAAFEIWSGFHLDDKAYINNFVNTMGYSPKYRSNPNYGKANLFIGLIIRFDILGRLGKTSTLVKEIKDIYLPQLRDGSGTFFEGYSELSGCHSVNALIGTLLTNKVLGLGQPMEITKSVEISPNPCGLNWARGAAKCSGGSIFMSYKADNEEHILDISLLLPAGWSYELDIPFELCGWKIMINGISVR